WLGTIYGQSPIVTTLRKYVSFHGEDRKIVTLQGIESMGKIDSWGIKARLMPGAAGHFEAEKNEAGQPFYEGQLLATLPRPSTGLTGSSRDITQTFSRPQKDMAVLETDNGEIWVVSAEGELDGENTDLWMSVGQWGKTFTPFVPLPINSPS